MPQPVARPMRTAVPVLMPYVAWACEIWHLNIGETSHLDGWEQRGFKTVTGNSAGCHGL
jgi:hypothetical protein